MNDSGASGREELSSAKAIDSSELMDLAPVLIWVSGPDKSGIFFNKQWLAFTGRTIEDERGEGWLTGVHPDDLPALEACAEAFSGRHPFRTEFRLRRHDGAWRWMLDTGVPRFTSQGEFAGFIGSCVDISEQKEAEAALRSSEQRLQLAQEAASIGTYDWQIAGDRLEWSAQMFGLYGVDPATEPKRIYDAWLERLHPEDRERADRQTREFVNQADTLTIEFRILHPEHGIRWIQGRGRVFRDIAGAPVRMIGVNFDMTDQRQAEEALRESEQRLGDIAENFPGIIFRRITYPDGRIEYPFFSGPNEAVRHVSRERLQAIKTVDDVGKLIHYDDLEETLKKFNHAATTLTPLDLEGRVIGADGEVGWVRSLSRPRQRGDGALVWDGVLLDVTEQHRRDSEHERAATMLQMAMEVAGIGTWEYDRDTGMVIGSGATNMIFGLSGATGSAPLAAYLEAVHPSDRERVKKGIVGGTVPGTSVSREYRVVSSDGGLRWISSRGSHVRLADGTERIIGALFDVTDRKQQEEDREAALHHQQMLLKELNHRVKNNLQMITSMLRLQATRSNGGQMAGEFQRAVERIQAISDLHAQLSFEGGIGQINFADYLNQLCDKMRKSVLAESSIDLNCQTDPCFLDLDRAVPLGLLINELVTNAVKYAFRENASGLICIRLRSTPDGGVAVWVEDSGVGMPVTAGKSKGLGMQLVEGLGQQISATIDRVEGPGTKYHISVPPKAAHA